MDRRRSTTLQMIWKSSSPMASTVARWNISGQFNNPCDKDRVAITPAAGETAGDGVGQVGLGPTRATLLEYENPDKKVHASTPLRTCLSIKKMVIVMSAGFRGPKC